MHRLRFIVPFAVLVLIAAACTSDEGGGGETGGASGPAQEENTGTVNVLSALAAEEADTLQTLWDSTYGSQVDYQVEFEGSEQFEEQLQIRSEAGTLDTILLPQPGAVKAQAASGNALSLEDLGLQHRRPQRDLRRVLRVAGRVRGPALRPARPTRTGRA